MLGAAESGGQALQSTLKRWFLDGTHVGRIDSAPRITALPEFIVPVMWLVFAGLIAGLTMKHARQDSSNRIPSICIVLCFVGLMLPPGWHHYFAFLPFVQLHLLQARPSKSSFGLLVLAILIGRIPILSLGLLEHSYAIASSFGATTLSTLLSWFAWINHLSSKNRKSNPDA